MPRPIDVSLGNDSFTFDSGALTADSFARFPGAGFSLLREAAKELYGSAISALPSDYLQFGLRAGSPLAWQVGNIALTLSPNVLGTVSVRRAGEIFRYGESENDDDPASQRVMTVPPGVAYVSVAFRAGLGISGGGSFSAGELGIKGSLENSDTFLLANHCPVNPSSNLKDALKQALSAFIFPFDESAYRLLPDGQFVEYEFYGRLNVAANVAIGFEGALLGGMSGGELRRSLNSPVGSLTASARPEVELSAAFSLGYKHEDAFRAVLSGMPDRTRMFLFKMDRSLVSSALKVTAGIVLNESIALQPQVDELVDNAAVRLFRGVSDESQRQKLVESFRERVKAAESGLTQYVSDAEARVADQVLKLHRLNVGAALSVERMSEHACLLALDFDKAAPAEGFRRALAGDLAAAVTQQGTVQAEGSYLRSAIRRTTSLSFQLFDAFKASSVRSYFDQCQLRYAGGGVFQLRLSTGLTAENNVFGHRRALEFYFEISAATAADGVIRDQDITLHIHTTDEKQRDAANRSAGLLHLILRESPFSGVENALSLALSANPDLPVDLSLVFRSSCYRRLPFTPFVAKDKPADAQTADALNYAAFVDAVDRIYAGGGFAAQGFPDLVAAYKHWAHYNVTAIDQEGAPRPANRRQRGNGNTDSVWPADSAAFPAARSERSSRPLLRAFMLAAQQFMNFCEDLPALARDLDDAATRERVDRVVDQAKDLVKETAGGNALFFTKPLAAALVAQCGGRVIEVQAPAGDPVTSFAARIVIA